MGINEILAQLDHEIGQLQQARTLLISGRPVAAQERNPKKRRLSPEGRRRIVEAVKRRWAAQKRKRTVGSARR